MRAHCQRTVGALARCQCRYVHPQSSDISSCIITVIYPNVDFCVAPSYIADQDVGAVIVKSAKPRRAAMGSRDSLAANWQRPRTFGQGQMRGNGLFCIHFIEGPHQHAYRWIGIDQLTCACIRLHVAFFWLCTLQVHRLHATLFRTFS